MPLGGAKRHNRYNFPSSDCNLRLGINAGETLVDDSKSSFIL